MTPGSDDRDPTPRHAAEPGLRARADAAFGRWAGRVVRLRWILIVGMSALTLALGSRLLLLETETSTEDYLFDRDPAKIAYDAFREQFGRDQACMVLVEPSRVFDRDFLEALAALHRDIEASVPHLAEVTSLYNVRSVRGEGSELLVDDLLETMPEDEAALARLEQTVRDTPSYLDSVISADGEVAILLVEADAYSSLGRSEHDESVDDLLAEFDVDGSSTGGEAVEDTALVPLTGRENTAFTRALLEVIERHRAPGLTIRLTGQPLITYALADAMAADVPRIFGAALLLIGVAIAFLFRRLAPVFLAAVIVSTSLVATMGVSQLLGIPVSLASQILPSFLLAVGVGYSVHLMTLFFRELAEDPDRGRALEGALRHVGLPISMTAVTTAAGLASFLVAEMEPVAQLGIMGAVGVAITLLYSLTLLPALLVVLPLAPGRGRGLDGGNPLLTACARMAIHHPRKLVAAAVVIALAAAASLPFLRFSSDPMDYFEEGYWLRDGTEYADRRIGGMQTLEVVIDTGRENGLHEPEVLRAMAGLEGLVSELARQGEHVGRTASLLDVVRETHRALNENRAAYYAIPDDRELVAQELLLFENSGSDDLEDLVDRRFSKARFSIRTTWEDGRDKFAFLARAAPRIEGALDGVAEVDLTGSVALIARVATATSESLVRSYVLALVLITPIMVLLIGSLRAGLASLVPNLVPILATLGLIVGLGLEMDMFMLLGGCIAIGLAVDDSIHFISGFRRHYAEHGDPERAVEETMETTGRALLFTSVVLVAGFAVLSLSTMANLANLGWMTACAIALAFVLDVTVTPALLVLLYRQR